MRRSPAPWPALLLLAAPLLFSCKAETLPVPGCPTGSAASPEGRCVPTCDVTSACLLNEVCVDGLCVGRSFDVPTVLLMAAEPSVVSAGGESVVRYLVQGADRIELLRSEPGLPDQSIGADNDTPEGGTERILRITQDTTIRLEAWRGERLASEQVTVRVRGQSEDVSILRFDVDPNQVPAGGAEVELSWEVENATDVRLVKNGSDLATQLAPQDKLQDQVRQTTQYTLVAEGPGGPVVAEQTVTVDDAPDLVINEVGFVPEAARIRVGDNAVIYWSTSGAEQVAVLKDGNPEYGTNHSELVANGRWLVSPPPGRNNYTVRAVAGARTPVTQRAALTVDERPATPTLTQVSVSPAVLPPDGRETTVTVSWTVQPANAQVSVVDANGTATVYTGSGQHSARVDGDQSVVFPVRASIAEGGADIAYAVAFAQLPEQEPNDLQEAADEIGFLARNGSLGRVQTGIDIDWYEFDAYEGARVTAAFAETMCPPGLRLELYPYGQGGALQGAQTGPNGTCPQLEVERLQEARYLLKVSRNMTVGQPAIPYLLTAFVGPPACGNSVLEAGEMCDDGNRSHGDYCSPECQLAASHDYEIFERGENAPPPPRNPETAVFTAFQEGLDAEDKGFAIIELPFPFRFFGRQFHGVAVFTDGYVSFLPRSGQDFQPLDFVGPQHPNAVIAAFVADLSVSGGGVRYWTEELSDANQIRFVIALDDFKWASAPDKRMSAQLQLYPNGRVAVVYGELQAPQGAAFGAGLEGPQGLVGYPLPGCSEDNGCEPNALRNRRYVITDATVTPGG